MKNFCALLVLLASSLGVSQNSKYIVEVSASAVAAPINLNELYYNPFGEYGAQFLRSENYGLKFGYGYGRRLSLALSGGIYNYYLDEQSHNPFPGATGVGTVLARSSSTRLQLLKMGVVHQFNFASLARTNFFLALGSHYYSRLKYRKTTDELYATAHDPALDTYETEWRTFESSGPILSKGTFSIDLGLGIQHRFTKHFSIALTVQGSRLQIPVYSYQNENAIERVKFELEFPFSLTYHF